MAGRVYERSVCETADVLERWGCFPSPDRWPSARLQWRRAVLQGSQEVKLQSSLSLSLIFFCTFHLLCMHLCSHLLPLHSFTHVNISACDKGTEGACWLVFVSVLEVDIGRNKSHAGSCPAQSLHWVPSLMATAECGTSKSHYLTQLLY